MAGGIRRAVVGAIGTATMAACALAGAAPAQAATVDFVDRLGCGAGLVPVATAQGAGSSLPNSFTSVRAQPVSQLSVTDSGFPPVNADFSASANDGSYRFFSTASPFNGEALDERYTHGSIEIARTAPGESVTFTTALPAPQRLFFTLLDFEFDAERAHIAGFNGTTVVIPTVFSRAEVAGTGVVIDPASDGVFVSGGTGVALSDFDPAVTADVVFDQPVDRVVIVQDNPSEFAGATSVDYSTMYGCQGLDLVESAGRARVLSATADAWTYQVPLRVIVGNTAPSGSMALYRPAVDAPLASLLGGSGPLGTLGTVSASLISGPPAVCSPDPTYDGIAATGLLHRRGVLAPGERCEIAITAQVSFPPFSAPLSRQAGGQATSAGLMSDASTNAAALPARVHGDQASAAAVTLMPVAITPSPSPSKPAITATPSASPSPSGVESPSRQGELITAPPSNGPLAKTGGEPLWVVVVAGALVIAGTFASALRARARRLDR